MNLYHVSQDENRGYDTYSDFVIAAETEEDARNTSPGGTKLTTAADWEDDWKAWASSPQNVTVKLIGTSIDNVPGVICASFNAG